MRQVGRSREGAWIEIEHTCGGSCYAKVAPARERGLKYGLYASRIQHCFVAPARERGLKFKNLHSSAKMLCVAPARERGLKSCRHVGKCKGLRRRSREGAWIEIIDVILMVTLYLRRSREGAWIEIVSQAVSIRLSRRRSREGAWIEIAGLRGIRDIAKSLPRGSVD